MPLANDQAARAVWRYHEASILHIFGHRLGDPLAERLLRAVRAAGTAGLDGRGQHAALDNNATKEQLAAAVERLVGAGLVEKFQGASTGRGGRPPTLLRAKQQSPGTN